MSTASPQTRITPDDLLAMPDEKNYELVDGELVERTMGNESGWSAGQLYRRLSDFCDQNDSGWVLGAETGYRCFSDDPNRVRKPDVSFVRKGRLPGERVARGYDSLPPDLAVEVISPNDLYGQVNIKVEEYLGAGVRLVWVIDPDSRTAHIHRADREMSRIHEDDDLDGEDVLPGFTCRLGDIFLPPAESNE